MVSSCRSFAPALGALTTVLIFWSAGNLSAAEHLTFRGTFATDKAEPGVESRKTFQVHLVETEAATTWCLVESAPGGFAWTERFGVRTSQAAAGKHRTVPTLLYDRGDGLSEVPLPAHRIPADKTLATDTTWDEGDWTYKVVGAGEGAGLPAWRIVVSNAYGPRQTLWVEKGSTLIVAYEARVFIGRGIECQLAWELADRVSLDETAATKIQQQFAALTELRDNLNLTPAQSDVVWKPEQLREFLTEFPKLKTQLTFAPLAELAQAAEKDAQTQDTRGDKLATLQKEALGKTPAKFALKGTSGEEFASSDLAGQVTVLHFWDYRDTPLEEPYGQVGYLDFLARAKKKDVRVFGVVVDERLDDESTRRQAVASAKKVKAFMNLSYPVLLDEDRLLAKLGDPQATGAKLPLWVVIGKDGRVAHYHVGFYEVNRDRGLAELDSAVAEALAKE